MKSGLDGMPLFLLDDLLKTSPIVQENESSFEMSTNQKAVFWNLDWFLNTDMIRETDFWIWFLFKQPAFIKNASGNFVMYKTKHEWMDWYSSVYFHLV